MKSNYGNGHKVNKYVQIFPSEAMIKDDRHDFAVYCSLLTASGIMSIETLQSLSDWIYHRDPRINKQVVETCKKIVSEKLGFIWLKVIERKE